jgi:hypothetical protein
MLVYIRTTCNIYPPIARIIAFSDLEKVIIKLTCGGARLFPIITRIDNGIHTGYIHCFTVFSPYQKPIV